MTARCRLANRPGGNVYEVEVETGKNYPRDPTLKNMKDKTINENRELIQSVIETLRQGECLLSSIRDEDYTRRLPVAFDASIGGHYRHCLDHFRRLLEAAAAGDLNYDIRERGTLIENDRFAALNATRELCEGYEKLDPSLITRSFEVTCRTSYSTSGSQVSASSVGREIMYAVAHAVHHYALIGIMAGIMKLTLPPGFGVAPSTLKYLADTRGPSAS